MKRYILAVVAVLVLAGIACGSSESSGTSPTRTPLPRAECVEQEFSGSGDSVVELPGNVAGCTKAHLTHSGSRNFIVVPYDANNERISSLANEIGPYNGSVKWDARAASLEVKADGAWTIAVQK